MSEKVKPYTRERLDEIAAAFDDMGYTVHVTGQMLRELVATARQAVFPPPAGAREADEALERIARAVDCEGPASAIVDAVQNTVRDYDRLRALASARAVPAQGVTDEEASALFDRWCTTDAQGRPVLDYDGFRAALAASRPAADAGTPETRNVPAGLAPNHLNAETEK